MLFDHPRTPLDLRFRLGPFPVTVNPFFWLGMAILGQTVFRAGFDLGLLWVACGFVSILWHELGHAVVMRRFGSPARIELHAFGGWAIPGYEQPSARRRLSIAAAGPAAGLLLWAALWGSEQVFHWAEPRTYPGWLYFFLTYINLIWSLFNLLPIWPLDGSRMLREAFVLGRVRQADRRMYQISFGTALALGVLGVIFNFGPVSLQEQVLTAIPGWVLQYFVAGPVMTLFLFLFAYQSYEMMRRYQRPRLYVDDRAPWER